MDYVGINEPVLVQNELMSECGLAEQESLLACCYCPFTSTAEDQILTHIATGTATTLTQIIIYYFFLVLRI
jgi:hypothetical protein